MRVLYTTNFVKLYICSLYAYTNKISVKFGMLKKEQIQDTHTVNGGHDQDNYCYMGYYEIFYF